MKQLKKLLSLALVICIVLCCSIPAQASITVTAVLGSLAYGLGMAMIPVAASPSLRSQLSASLSTAWADFAQQMQGGSGYSFLQKETLTDANGNSYIEVSGQDVVDLVEAYGDNLPTSYTAAASLVPKYSDYVARYNVIWRQTSGSTSHMTVDGYFYEYHAKVNLTSDITRDGVKDAAIFLYVPTTLTYRSITSASVPFVTIVEQGSAAYSFVVALASSTQYTNAYTVQNETGYLNGYWQSISASNQNTMTAYQPNIENVFVGNATTIGVQLREGIIAQTISGIVFSSTLFPDINGSESVDLQKMKSYYAEYAAKLQALIDSNASLRDAVIGIPAGEDDSIGDDLPGLIAILKAMSVNEGADTQSLIGALETSAAASAAATEALSSVAEQVESIAGDLMDIKEQIADVTQVVTGDNVPSAPSNYALDLSDYFPFCIPFDLIDFISVLNAEPEAPSITWPVKVNYGGVSINENIEIDLSVYESVAEIMRTMELLLFCVGLAFATRGLIRG